MNEKAEKPAGPEKAKSESPKRRVTPIPVWVWPIGLAAAGIGTAAAVLLRGCWHRNMSWPVRYGEHAYQTCNDCGIMRLFDEKRFRAFGPYAYDLDKLITIHEQRRRERVKKVEDKRPESNEEDFVI